MGSIVIAEKPSQANDYKSAVGTQYGTVLAARGHLFTLAEPEDENSQWKEWTIGVMRPDSGFFRIVLQKKDADIKKRYEAIKSAARNANRIFIATDPDREGEGIGRNIVNQLRRDIQWNGELLRVLPLGNDKKSLEEAFANAQPADDFKNLYQSWMARAQSDQIFNLSLTRSATRAFLPEGRRGSLSVGRVLTPTFGMVCQRHLEIANFEPRQYFTPWVEVTGQAGRVRLTHTLKEEDRIFDHSKADEIAVSAANYDGPIAVKEERKKQSPPALFSLSKLQVEASRRMKWGVKKTLDVLQALYEKHKVATYPRSSETTLPESMIDDIVAMRAGALALPFISQPTWAADEPVVRRKKGAFSDKALKGAAHYAIVPNVNTANDWAGIFPNMTSDEQRLFEIIVRRYLSVIAPDRVYDSTRMSISVESVTFSATGTVEVSPGWREALEKSAAPVDEDSDAEELESKSLPAFKDGDAVRSTSHGVAEKMTTPPPAYTEATLETAMVEVWKLVTDERVRAKLKETDGIGTVATRANIISNLTARGFVKTVNNKLEPTPEGLEFYQILNHHTPRLLDVGLTGEMELSLENVKSGEVGARTAVESVVALAESAVQSFVHAKQQGTVVTPPVTMGGKKRKGRGGNGSFGKPTGPMINAAKAKAKSDGLEEPPKGTLDSFDACRSYLGPLKGKPGTKNGKPKANAGSPSIKQLELAEKLSAQHKVELPDETKKDRRKISEWISMVLEKKKGKA